MRNVLNSLLAQETKKLELRGAGIVQKLERKETEDITCPRVDMNFIFDWSDISRVSAVCNILLII